MLKNEVTNSLIEKIIIILTLLKVSTYPSLRAPETSKFLTNCSSAFENAGSRITLCNRITFLYVWRVIYFDKQIVQTEKA